MHILNNIFNFHEGGNIYIPKNLLEFLYKLLVENSLYDKEKYIFFDFFKNILLFQTNNYILKIIKDEDIENMCLEKIPSNDIHSLNYSAYESIMLYLIYINDKNGNITYSYEKNRFIEIKKLHLLLGFKMFLKFYIYNRIAEIAVDSMKNLENIIEVSCCDLLNRKYILEELFSQLNNFNKQMKLNATKTDYKIIFRRILKIISYVNKTKVSKNLFDENDPFNTLMLNINNNYFSDNENNTFVSFNAFKGLTIKQFKDELIENVICKNDSQVIKDEIRKSNTVTLYYQDTILKDEYTLAEYNIKTGDNILIMNGATAPSHVDEFCIDGNTSNEAKEAYEQINLVFPDKYSEEVINQALKKNNGDVENTIIFMTDENNINSIYKELERKKNIVQVNPIKIEQMFCLEDDQFNLLLDILSNGGPEIIDSIWDLFKEIKFKDNFITNVIEEKFNKINSEKNLNNKILVLKIVNSIIFDDKTFCQNNKIEQGQKNLWISKFLKNESLIKDILINLSETTLDNTRYKDNIQIIEIFINFFIIIFKKISEVKANNDKVLNINQVMANQNNEQFTIEESESDSFINILNNANFILLLYKIIENVMKCNTPQIKSSRKKIIQNIYDINLEYLKICPHAKKLFLNEENNTKIIVNILLKETDVELRKVSLNYLKELIKNINNNLNDIDEDTIDIQAFLLSKNYNELISDDVYFEEFYELYSYLFNLKEIKSDVIPIEQIISKFFDYLYQFYIDQQKPEKDYEKRSKIMNKLKYNLFILSSFTPIFNEVLKNDLEKRYKDSKDIIIILYNLLFEFEKIDKNLNYIFSNDELRKNSFNLLTNIISIDKKYFNILLEKIIQHHINIPEKKSYLPLSEPLRNFKAKKFLGLKNLGCTCYLNSLFQQMFMIPTLYKDIFEFNMLSSDNNINLNESIIYNMQTTFVNLKNSIMAYYPPMSFIKSFKKAFNGEPIVLGVQQDADEFLSILCDKLEEEAKKFNRANFLENSFKGKITNEIVSLEKDYPYYSQREEPYYRITLDIKGHKKLEEALDAYVKGEILDGDNQYFVEKYNKKLPIKKRTSLKKISNQIIITLKRFEFDFFTFQNNKLNDYLEFPLKINFKKWTRAFLRMNEVEDKNEDKIEEIEKENLIDEKMDYELTGILIHSGASLQSGHYYSYIKDLDTDKWYEFNDSSINDYDIDKNLKKECFGNLNSNINQYGRGAYLLFYTKRECIDKYKKNEQKIEIDEKILKKVEEENIEFLKLKTFYNTNYHDFIIKFIKNYLILLKKDEKDKQYKAPNDYNLLIGNGLKHEINKYKKICEKLKVEKLNELPNNIGDILDQCTKELNNEKGEDIIKSEDENIKHKKILEIFLYYFFGFVIQYDESEKKFKDCLDLLKAIGDSNKENIFIITKFIEDNFKVEIFVDLLFKFGYKDKDMKGINQYIYNLYIFIFYQIYTSEKEKFGSISKDVYTFITIDDKGKHCLTKYPKSIFLRLLKKIFLENLEISRKEYMRNTLFMKLFYIINISYQESTFLVVYYLIFLISFITNNNIPEFRSIMNPNFRMKSNISMFYLLIFYDTILRCQTKWMLSSKGVTPYIIYKPSSDKDTYPQLPDNFEQIYNPNFFLDYLLSIENNECGLVLSHLCYEDESTSMKILKMVNDRFKRKILNTPMIETIYTNICQIFEINDSLTQKRLETLFELEKKEPGKETLLQFYSSQRYQIPIIVLNGIFCISKAIEKYENVFEYFKKNKKEVEWVRDYYMGFFNDKVNLLQNLSGLLNKHQDLFQVIEAQFISRLDV